jgi:hypothetical protein
MHYKFSRREIARHRGNDCGINVIEAGDYCMLRPDIWERLGLGWTDNLCLACIEKRLGRNLSFMDFAAPASVEGFPPSDTLLQRLGLSGRPRKRRRAQGS